MLTTDQDLFTKAPGSTFDNWLYRGSVTGFEGEKAVAVFKDVPFTLTPDQEFIVYFEHRRKFMQQSARVACVREADPALVVELELKGEPVSAENRENYRVSTISANVGARVADEHECQMVDISVAGFGVVAKAEHLMGTTIETSVSHDDQEFSGTMLIQSVRDLGRNGMRYGLRYLEDEAAAGTLRTGLQRISLQVEREMLRRKSGMD